MDYAKKIKKSKSSIRRDDFDIRPPGDMPVFSKGSDYRSGRRFYQRPVFFIALAALVFIFFSGRYVWREMRWRYIVIHHTASDYGSLEYYRKLHMQERGWPDVAYHFIVNNGSDDTTVGQVQESEIWQSRSHHYSTKNSFVNYFGIAVVLVGNFENHSVPAVQHEALLNLTVRLSREYGIPPERIIGHREIWATACPGHRLNMAEFREDVKTALNRP